jgi:predicted RNA-binding protein associated with RNAse of E/G family
VPGGSESWLATWRVPQRSLHISVEVCTWIRRDLDVVSFLDWELDPFRLRSGLVAVEDLDDFAEARSAGLMNDEDAESALAAAAWVERALRRQSAPFDARGDRRLDDAGQSRLPALVDVPHPFDL